MDSRIKTHKPVSVSQIGIFAVQDMQNKVR